MVKLVTPLTEDKTKLLKAGDMVLLSGVIYTARDAAHKRMIEQYKSEGIFPFDVKDSTIYYVGPSPAKEDEVIGSAGPTTSYRMDAYTPFLLDKGLKAMIGKGTRDKSVISSMKKNKSIYFAAVGGAAALISSHIVESQVIAYNDLGTEAIRRLVVKDMPLTVVIDCYGSNLYESERAKYKK